MSIYHSRHTAYSKKAVPRKKRAIALYGEGSYRGKWWRCWNCGFINSIDRAQIADSYVGGDSYSVVESVDDLSIYGMGGADTTLYYTLTIDNPSSMNLMKVDATGAVINPQHSSYAKIVGGCAYCGCKNWR
jgi:hypothetical protein